jgi:DNA-binding NarL/FixJ family response regulator
VDQARVVILSGRSLFAEGVASRLRQHSERLEIQTIDPHLANITEQVIAAQPTAVILDASDPDAEMHCSIGELLVALPSLKIIRLDPQQPQIQVVTSEQRTAGEVRDLIDLIEPPE